MAWPVGRARTPRARYLYCMLVLAVVPQVEALGSYSWIPAHEPPRRDMQGSEVRTAPRRAAQQARLHACMHSCMASSLLWACCAGLHCLA